MTVDDFLAAFQSDAPSVRLVGRHVRV